MAQRIKTQKEISRSKIISIVNMRFLDHDGKTRETDFDDSHNGHGTHVMSTAAGASSPRCLPNEPSSGARLLVFDFGIAGNHYLEIPPLLTPILSIAYASGSRIFSASWGTPANYYSSYAYEIDKFIHEHDDFVVLVANGNSGAVPWISSEGSVGAPATAKNIISVGASLNSH